MVKKGKNTDVNIRSLAIYHRKKGKTIREIAKILNLSSTTVHNICKRFFESNVIEDKPRSGRPAKLNKSDVKFLIREVKQQPEINSTELKQKLKEFNKKEVHTSTIRKKLNKNGYFSRIARRKPKLSDINKRKRFNFAKNFKDKGIDFWKKVIFVDESKFNLFKSDSKQERRWRKANTELEETNICGTVKHGGKSAMVWGAMSYNGVGNLSFIETTMNKEGYLKILKENLIETANNLNIRNDFYFYQDNDPKHKSWIVRSWLLYNCPHVLETPPQSPDINPIEHLWAFLETQLRKRKKLSSISKLKEALKDEWSKIPQDFIKKLVESMPRRLQEVYKRKGNHTRY